MGPGRQSVPGARRRDPEPGERRPCGGRHVRHLEAQEGRKVARRQAVHRRRRRVQLGICLRSRDRRRDHRQLQGRQGREGRRLHGDHPLRQADAVLGGCLRRRARPDHPETPVRRLHRRQVARRADQPQARRHRPLSLRRLQAGRHRQGRAQSQLPRCQPAALRQRRDEGRRRCRVGRTRRHPDRRIRLCLEHAGGGRDPAAAREGRQGHCLDHARRQHRAHTAQLAPIPGPRSTASVPA